MYYVDDENNLLNDSPCRHLSRDLSLRDYHGSNQLLNLVFYFRILLNLFFLLQMLTVQDFMHFQKYIKYNIPLRLIVSNIGTASYRLPKHLTTLLSHLHSPNIHTVKNSITFPKVIQTLSFTNLTVVSFDVKSLFINVLTSGPRKRLREFHFKQFCNSSIIFSYFYMSVPFSFQ